ncbi:hypothetical protein [Demequina maris]|uniref:hypothetical protein n=1 Tax=Demequina maris TaxID=1638982 RepID=UPI001470633B|nr:hypothetical protein [Demequina maris]
MIAISVLGVVLVAVLGWFLAIKPQLNAASEASAQATSIRDNTVLIQASSAKLDEYQSLLEEDDSTADAIALNAPSRLDMDAFRTRLWKIADGANVDVISYALGTGQAVDGWETEPGILVSNQVASLFGTGPVAGTADQASAETTTTDTEGTDAATTAPGAWTPVITPNTEPGPVAGDIRMVDVTLDIAGTASEVDAFLSKFMDVKEQIFQVYDVTETVGGPTDTLDGAEPSDDDLTVTIIGALYVHNADLSIQDQSSLKKATPKDGAFAASAS